MSSGDDQRLKRFVTNLYYGALHRDPTAQELADASNQLAAAGAQGQPQLLGTAKQVARALFTQTSYETSPARTDSQYVSDLYYTYMQRAGDDPGLAWWVSQLASKGRSGVCDDFQNSIEFDVLVTTLYGNATSDNQRTEQFVNNFYLGAYGRFPTQAESQQQRDALNAEAAKGQDEVKAQAEAMGRALFAAQVNDFSISAQQFVTNLYEGFLQRGPDASGLSFWTTQAGTTATARQNVLSSFATSPSAKELAGALYREAFWLVTDHLGTPRMVADKSGSLAGIKRHDYLPFGEELLANTGGRTPALGYSAVDNVRQKFTGKERDNETGLDYFINRYYSPAQGRFAGADPVPMTSQRPPDPQRLNLYAYTRNNPLCFTDPNGLELYATGDAASLYEADIERATGLTLQRDRKTGKLRIVKEPNKLSKVAAKIKEIINDREGQVHIRATSTEGNSHPAGTLANNVLGGQFWGGGEQTIDYGDVRALSSGGRGGFTSEGIAVHETVEAYAGRMTLNSGQLSPSEIMQYHMVGMEYENYVRAQQGLGARTPGDSMVRRTPGEIEFVTDFTTHIERIVIDRNKPGTVKSVKVEKKL